MSGWDEHTADQPHRTPRRWMYSLLSLLCFNLVADLSVAAMRPGDLVGSFQITRFVVGDATFIAGYTAPAGTARLHFPLSPWTDRGRSEDAGHLENVVYHPPTDGASRPRLLLAQNTPPVSPDGRNPGLYVQVLDGTIHVTNGGGTQNFTAGQFGFIPGFKQPPVILPTNPGMQFTPPPSFSSTIGTSGGTSAPKPGDVNCQVR
jgi:hypothetical protein